MATKNTDPVTWNCTTDQSAAQYLFLRATGDRVAATCNTLGQRAIGIQDDAPTYTSGLTMAVAVANQTSKRPLIKLGATLAANAEVTSSATGVAVAATTGHVVNAILVEGGVSGDIVPCQFLGSGRIVP